MPQFKPARLCISLGCVWGYIERCTPTTQLMWDRSTYIGHRIIHQARHRKSPDHCINLELLARLSEEQ